MNTRSLALGLCAVGTGALLALNLGIMPRLAAEVAPAATAFSAAPRAPTPEPAAAPPPTTPEPRVAAAEPAPAPTPEPAPAPAPAAAVAPDALTPSASFALVVHFDSASAALSSSDLTALRAFAAATPSAGGLTLGCFTDRLGDRDVNQRVSQRRCDAVIEVLTAAGVARERIAYAARGEGATAGADGSDDPEARIAGLVRTP
ncbi:MAG: OmpA family protein [Myxococcota bacterium]